MLSIRFEIFMEDSLTNITRFHNTITGVNSKFEVIQVDTHNHIIEKTMSFINKDYQFPKVHACKYLKTANNSTYYFTFDKKITNLQGKIIEQSNSKASFVKGLDGHDNLFVFAKFHHTHNKYSLNVKKMEKQKKLVTLLDDQINQVSLIKGENDKSILISTQAGVSLFYGQDWDVEEPIKKIESFLVDHNYAYLITGLNQKNSPSKLNNFNPNGFPKNQQHGNYLFEAFSFNKLTKGKGYSEFQFSLNRFPIKIDCFQTDLIVAFDNSIEIYDVRKITKPFQKVNQNGVKDFYYEPNLQRVFLSCRKGLLIYDYK